MGGNTGTGEGAVREEGMDLGRRVWAGTGPGSEAAGVDEGGGIRKAKAGTGVGAENGDGGEKEAGAGRENGARVSTPS